MRTFASDRLELSPDGVFLLLCSMPKAWTPRRPKTLLTAEFPGTAVRWDGSLFEVTGAVSDAAGGVTYRLEPWQDRHAIRVIEDYDDLSEAARQAEHARRQTSLARRRLSILLSPLLGHLPGRVQREMENEFGAPARAMTIASAMPLLVLGVLGIGAFLALSFGATASDFRGWPILPLPVSVYLFGESSLRAGVAFLHDRPIGSVVGTVFFALWRLASGRRYAFDLTAKPDEPGKGDS